MTELFPQFLLVAGGVGALYFGAEWLVRGAAGLAERFGVPPVVVGLTVVSLGTSAPELTVSIIAALGGNPDVAVGNVLGSNLANIGLVLGLTALITPLNVHAQVVRREIPAMFVFTLVAFPVLFDLEVSRGDGVILVSMLVGYLILLLRAARDEPEEVVAEFKSYVTEEAPAEADPPGVWRLIGLILIGGVLLVAGGRAIVTGATVIAQAAGIPDLLIGMTVVAIGTSLPELATSVVAALRDEADIAVGNVVGSNIFNLGTVLGITALVTPIPVSADVLTFHYPAVLMLTLLVVPFARSRMRVGRWEGAVLLALYVAGAALAFIR